MHLGPSSLRWRLIGQQGCKKLNLFNKINALVVFFSHEEGLVNVKPRFLLGYWKILIQLRQNTVTSHLDYWYQTDFLYWKKK